MNEKMRVGIIGGGPSGLVSAKEVLQNGLIPIIFEKEGRLGGVWNHLRGGRGCVWDSLRTNISKFSTVFGDVPWPKDADMFPSAKAMDGYLNDYADRWGLRDFIKFNCTVTKVIRKGGGVDSLKTVERGRCWEIHWTEEESEEYMEFVGGVVVASGFFSSPYIPQGIRGLDSFPGKVIHSRDYKTLESTNAGCRKVLTIGGSLSGAEIAADLATTSLTTSYHAFRRPFWILRRYLSGGKKKDCHNLDRCTAQIPIDLLFYSRAYSYPKDRVAEMTYEQENLKRNSKLRYFCGDQEEFKELKVPEEMMSECVNTVISDNYVDFVREGGVVPIRGEIKEIKGSEVVFTNGRTLKGVDAIVFATGFRPQVNFLGEEILAKLSHDPDDHLQPFILFNSFVHPELDRIFFVGLYKGPTFAGMEQQARFAARLLSGRICLPAEELMGEGMKKEMRIRNTRKPHRPQFPHGDQVLFADRIAWLSGSLPSKFHKLETDATLLEALFEGHLSRVAKDDKAKAIMKQFMTGPAIPPNYNLLSEDFAGSLEQMDYLDHVMNELNSCSHK